jgi:transposase
MTQFSIRCFLSLNRLSQKTGQVQNVKTVLSVKGLAKTKLAKSVADASFGKFRRQLEYKTAWNRRHLAVIGRWFPSSKACHECGCVNDNFTRADRRWTELIMIAISTLRRISSPKD